MSDQFVQPSRNKNVQLWPEAMATVTACKYDFGAGRALAFGIPTTKHFRITFNYWAPNAEGEAELHTGEFASKKYLPQGHLFPITYNPDRPHEHSQSLAQQPTRNPLIPIAIAASAIIFFLWLATAHGCN